MDHNLNHIHRQLNWLKAYAVASSLLFGAALLSFTSPSAKVLRATGIVIEDEQGRDRILIGAPIPASRQRVRTNLARVKKAWAPKLGGEQYMQAYAAYDNSASGIVFLTEDGFDKLIVGEHIPDPNTGKRLITPSGIMLNDDNGFERAGFGVSKTSSGQYRAALGLDDAGGEAGHLFVLEDGTKGLRVVQNDGQLFAGSLKANGRLFTSEKDSTGFFRLSREGKVQAGSHAPKK